MSEALYPPDTVGVDDEANGEGFRHAAIDPRGVVYRATGEGLDRCDWRKNCIDGRELTADRAEHLLVASARAHGDELERGGDVPGSQCVLEVRPLALQKRIQGGRGQNLHDSGGDRPVADRTPSRELSPSICTLAYEVRTHGAVSS